ncbi:hypothetical protein [Antrihabitans stalactiti]|uniref:Lipoprotein n=1 Tax=Antrihabitans stalactiti TaxID=2584121 RepID=A0A848K8F0_9NOCA|nr:hypothetical protein [Antrihabitans stalactiti]NMN93906.1 hypothetical protein [Antrihabitans stalactiti]
MSAPRVALACVAVLLPLLAGCGSSDGDSQTDTSSVVVSIRTWTPPSSAVENTPPPTSPAEYTPPKSGADKYKQTWTTPYEETTCSQFKTAMSGKQQWVLAADMLTSARQVDEKGAEMASDDLITEFRNGLVTVCVIDTMTMTDAGVGLYMTEPRFKP